MPAKERLDRARRLQHSIKSPASDTAASTAVVVARVSRASRSQSGPACPQDDDRYLAEGAYSAA